MASVVWDYVLNKLRCRDNGGGGGGYVLPPATPTTLGGVKVGKGLSVASDGTLSLAAPAVGDTPPALADGQAADWYDTTTDTMFHLARVSGKTYAVEMTRLT